MDNKTLLNISMEDNAVHILSGDVKTLRKKGDDILAKMFEVLPDDILEEFGSMIVEMASKVIALSTDAQDFLKEFDRATMEHIRNVTLNKGTRREGVVVPFPATGKPS